VTIAESKAADFMISRVFDAPRDLVWKCFTDPECMKQWWGPKGFTVIASRMDLRPGGTYHYGMTAPDGTSIWGKMVYREICPPERLVFINSFSDEAGGTTRHPMAPHHPALRSLHLKPLGVSGPPGPIATAGGVVFLTGGGDELLAIDARSGAQLWSSRLLGSRANPMTYRTGTGRQFVVVANGEGTRARLSAFALPRELVR
jgi:uncharacterized protein YndB with AHSA1/START domain